MIISIPVALFGIFWPVSQLGRRLGLDWQDQLLATVAVFGSLLVFLTELLSLFSLVGRGPLTVAWWLVGIGGAIIGYRFYRRNRRQHVRLEEGNAASDTSLSWVFAISAIMVGHVLVLLAIALRYEPNTFDSMTYHLPRTMHWAQAGSVRNYATHIDRQLQMPPFAELVLLHIDVLGGTDQLFNLVQFAALVLLVVATAGIVKKLGGSTSAQLAASALAMSTPMAILQSTSTQNDLVLSLWLVMFVAFLVPLAFDVDCRKPVVHAIMAGISGGLAILTKGSALIFILPITLVLVVARATRSTAGTVWKEIALVILVGSLLNVGHFSRNLDLYRQPVGPTENYRNETLSARVVTSNMLRNLAIHIPLMNRFELTREIGVMSLRALESVHGLTGLSATDPRTSWGDRDVFEESFGFWRDEDYAGNSLHLVLIAGTTSGLFFASNKERSLGIGLLLSFVLFSALLKWQPWGSRLQLPAFMLWMPLSALFLQRIGPSFLRLVVIGLWIGSLPWLLENKTRPFELGDSECCSPRSSGLFTKREEWYDSYDQVTEEVTQLDCDQIGLILGANAWEYPIWLMLEEKGFVGQISHVEVTNESTKYAQSDFNPCAIIASNDLAPSSSQFEEQIDTNELSLYLR